VKATNLEIPTESKVILLGDQKQKQSEWIFNLSNYQSLDQNKNSIKKLFFFSKIKWYLIKGE
jgi:hypothetical protein